MALRRDAGSDAVVTGGTAIAFDTPYPIGSSYIVFANCYDGSGDVGYNITVQSVNGFTVVPLVDATFEWEAVQLGTEEVPDIVASGRLSRDWTAGDFWAEAVRDAGIEIPPLFQFERFQLIQRAVEAVASQLYGLYGNDYMTDTEVTITSNEISLTTLRIMRGGQQMRISLSSVISSATVQFYPVSELEFNNFRSSSQNNKGLFRYTFAGETIKVQKHSDSAVYGTPVTLTYPRVPIKALTDAQKLDLPDGLPMEIASYTLRSRLLERYGTEKNKKDYTQQVATLIQRVYDQFGVAIDLTETQQKAKVLV